MKGYSIGLGIGLLFVLLSYLTLNSTVYGLGDILGPYLYSFLFPAIAVISLVYGLIKLVRRNKISKDKKITRLEKRLDDIEKDKEDSSSPPPKPKDSFKPSEKLTTEELERKLREDSFE